MLDGTAKGGLAFFDELSDGCLVFSGVVDGGLVFSGTVDGGSVFGETIVRMAKAAKQLQAILDYMKKVKLSTSTVFGQFP